MNYKEYFKQQLVESIMEDTFAEREASQGRAAARSKAEYFTGLMAAVGRRRAAAGVPMGPKNEGQKVEDLTGQREVQMYKKHTGTSPKDLLDGKRHDTSARTITHQLGQGTAPR